MLCGGNMTHTTTTPADAANLCLETRPATPKPYSKPEVILELELETRAGSPLGFPDPMDPLGLNLRDFNKPDP